MSTGYTANEAAPAKVNKTCTPSDVTEYSGVRGIWVGVAGNVSITGQDETTAIWLNVPQGSLLPIAAKRINATGTSATDIVLLF